MKKRIFLALPCVALSLNVVAWREANAATRVFNNYAVSHERLDTGRLCPLEQGAG